MLQEYLRDFEIRAFLVNLCWTAGVQEPPLKYLNLNIKYLRKRALIENKKNTLCKLECRGLYKRIYYLLKYFRFLEYFMKIFM